MREVSDASAPEIISRLEQLSNGGDDAAPAVTKQAKKKKKKHKK
jgi:hypothetical protein